jgi:dTDP-glucose 4,6-dehydratase
LAKTPFRIPSLRPATTLDRSFARSFWAITGKTGACFQLGVAAACDSAPLDNRPAIITAPTTIPLKTRSLKILSHNDSPETVPDRVGIARLTSNTIRGMTVCVVTGGAGFVGSHLCDALLEKGSKVICIDNLDTGSLQNLEHIDSPDFTFLNQDITETVEIEGEVDFVYHLASPASPIDYARLPLHTLKVGAQGTWHMLGVAKFKRARFLLASTSEVYGDPQVHPQEESYWGHVNPIGPRGVYDEAKRYAEALTMAYHRQQGVNTSIVRIFNTYGSRMRAHDGRAIPTFLRQALQNQPLTVFGDGSQTRSFCFVDDLVRGLILLAESGEHLPVNIGNPDEYTLLQLANAVIEASGADSSVTFEPLPTDDPQVRQPNIDRAREVLGWEPTVPLSEGLRKTIDLSGRDRLIGKTS